MPFRPWREHCANGKAGDDPHPGRANLGPQEARAVTNISIDHGSIRLEGAEPRTIIVLKVSGKGPVAARCVTGKGREDATVFPWLVGQLRRLGPGRCIPQAYG